MHALRPRLRSECLPDSANQLGSKDDPNADAVGKQVADRLPEIAT
jgi:hypothetical protein